MNGQRDDFEEQFYPTDDEWRRRDDDDGADETQSEETPAVSSAQAKWYRCVVCAGTGWMEYPHPDDEDGFMAVVGPCPACVEDGLCPACGEGTMAWGTLSICVHCGFTFDESAAPQTAGGRL